MVIGLFLQHLMRTVNKRYFTVPMLDFRARKSNAYLGVPLLIE